MGWLVYSVIPLACAFYVYYKIGHLYSGVPVSISGTVDPQYEEVRRLFRSNFENSWEPEGAAITVFHKGKKVVDLWGGYADSSAYRLWKEDTMTIVFSTTKAVSALCVALLVDRGLLKYDDPIVKFWPAFGNNGKTNVTVQMVVSHMSGLPFFDEKITEEAALDHNIMRQMIENERPKWPPGTATGYHPYTYGWLVDQIIRHVDPKKRGLGQFLREEITVPNGIDFHIGLNAKETHRVARVTTASTWQQLSEIVNNIKVYWYLKNLGDYYKPGTLLYKSVHNAEWLDTINRCTLNNPDFYKLEQGGALGIGNARSLATMFNLVLSGKIISKKTLDQLQNCYINETDVIFHDKVAKGNGLLYLPLNRAGVEHVVGHTGHGCQQVIYDSKNDIVISYVGNGLKAGLYDLCRTYSRLQNAIYDIIEKK